MSNLQGKKIILAVYAGIAAYKAPFIVRGLKKLNADVQVVLSENASKFVTKTTLQAVSGNSVRQSLWDESAEAAMGHIELAKWADIILLAPATANSLRTLAQGGADDLITTLILATTAKIYVAPSMNQAMFNHPATQKNLKELKKFSYQIIGPESGDQACGDEGPGRMSEPEEIIRLIDQASHSEPKEKLAGLQVMITTGPTRERLDPVRYITNDSSGTQGIAIAQAACRFGAEVTLIAGPNVALTSAEIKRIDIESADQMNEAVQSNLSEIDLFIGVAAIADYKPKTFTKEKLKRSTWGDNLSLELTENPDVILNVANAKPKPLVIGFAAETTNPLTNAREKRIRKGMDAIIVNDVSDPEIGFNSKENAVTLIHENGELIFEKQSKIELANNIIEQLITIFSLNSKP